MRFLVEECIPRQIVAELRLDGHDVVWAREVCAGDEDTKVPARAAAEERIILTEDRDFGELTVRFKLSRGWSDHCIDRRIPVGP